ncbi:MAG: (Fe-S)-binding protein [Actinobacteria bacterium]|nr:(Fe-S)-binding protein [Actinomycetota bacterium]
MTRASGARVVRLDLDDDDLAACVACGLCLPHCPTYRVTGLEAASPRGRITAMRAVQWDGAAVDATFARYMEECVQCRGCEAACPSSVPFGRLMEGARTALHDDPPVERSRARRVVEWFGYRVLLPRHRLLVAFTWVLLVAQRLHLVPKRASASLPELSARALTKPLRVRRTDGAPGAAQEDGAYLFTGCVMDAWQRHVHRAAVDVMQAAGASVRLPGRGGDCCGALHLHAGRVDEARSLASRVIASMSGEAPVVVDSAGCGAAMKDYGHLLDSPEAHAFAARVRDFGEWVRDRPLPVRPTGRRVVVQDPCHLRHVQRAAAPTHELLARAYEVVATDDDGLCCGAGGVYAALQPHLAGDIRARKVDALRRAGGTDAPLVASANPGCVMHLRGAGLDVRHPAELVAAALRKGEPAP